MPEPATVPAPASEMTLEEKRARANRLTADCKKFQEEYTDQKKTAPLKIIEEVDGKAKEAAQLWTEIRREEGLSANIAAAIKHQSEIVEPTLPAGPEAKASEGQIVGYIEAGLAAVLSDGYKQAKANDFGPGRIYSAEQLVVPPGSTKAYLPLTKAEREKVEARAVELKAVPTIGAGIIEPQRLPQVPRVTADDRLRLRDVMTVGRITSGSGEYVREESFTNLAAETAHGADKPESGLEYTLQTAAVATIAHWMRAHVQQLDDWAQLRMLIEGRLRYGVIKREEQQIVYGDGNSPNLEGILDPGVTGTVDISGLARYSSTATTLIDAVRMGITEVTVNGYDPNALLIDPIDWEEIILQKGSDNHYVWVIVTDANGSRIWGLRVVESVGARGPDGQRNLVVADWRNGAALLIRQDLAVLLGMAEKDFIQNIRRLLAEERVALPIFAPKAFAYLETAAAST